MRTPDAPTRFATILAAAALAGAWGCGGTSGTPTSFTLEVRYEFRGDATGLVYVNIGLGTGGACEDTDSGCSYDMLAETQNSLRAEPGAGSVFVEWTGDCSGTADTYTIDAEPGDELVCTAVFAADDEPSDEVRDGGMVRSHHNCTLTSDEPVTFDCSTLGPYGMAHVWVPPAEAEAQFGRPNEDCYTWVETDGQIPSQDLGDVTLATSLVTGTATHDGFGYQVTGIPLEGDPFAATDELSVTTSAGTVSTPTPAAPRVAAQPYARLTLLSDADLAPYWIWGSAGYTGSGDFAAAVCRFGAATELEVTPDAAVEALLSIDLFPNVVYAGPTSTAEVESWDDVTRRFDAARTLGFSGTELAAAGELDELK